ncbi:MAG: J domain-containing protein [archaeon]
MANQYGLFGAEEKESPKLRMARSVLGVGRAASPDEIKKIYRKLSLKLHPDVQRDKSEGAKRLAEERFNVVSTAYGLLTDPDKSKKAHETFQDALEKPFLVGHRVFCLGTLYGIRVYVPKKEMAISDFGRLLGKSSAPANIQANVKPYGSRNSIMESELADLAETYLGGERTGSDEILLGEAYRNAKYGAMDDLPWISNSDLAVGHFMDRKFEVAVECMSESNRRVKGNIIFLYRQGVVLEALVAQPGWKKEKKKEWKDKMGQAIQCYELARLLLKNRKESWHDDSGYGRFDPKSLLTVTMQLADAYCEIGDTKKGRELWQGVQNISPNCYEANMRMQELRPRIPMFIGGLLSFGSSQ